MKENKKKRGKNRSKELDMYSKDTSVEACEGVGLTVALSIFFCVIPILLCASYVSLSADFSRANEKIESLTQENETLTDENKELHQQIRELQKKCDEAQQDHIEWFTNRLQDLLYDMDAE